MQHTRFNHIIYRMIYVKMRSRRKIMEQESETDSQTQSQFPSQEERIHARAALAMFGKFDIEEQETASDDSQAETQQGWNHDFDSKLLTCKRNQFSRSQQHQTYYDLTLQICISKDKLFCQKRQGQSSENHQKDASRMRHRKV